MTAGQRARVVFMGSPSFAVPTLRALHDAGYDIPLVVTQPDRPAGRGGRTRAPEVKVEAEKLGIAVAQPERLAEESARSRLAAGEADVFVVAAYGKILPQGILEIPRLGCLNVHASLLPRWRGPSPINAAILAGDAETGITIMKLVRQMDAGPVLARAAAPVGASATTATLEPELARMGADLLVDTLARYLLGEVTPVAQDESRATYCRLLTKADGFLRSEMTVDEAWRAVRAYNPWPTASVGYGGQRLNIWAARPLPAGAGVPSPGAMDVIERSPAIAFRGGWLMLEEVQKVGGRRISGQAFLNGERGRLAPAVALA